MLFLKCLQYQRQRQKGLKQLPPGCPPWLVHRLQLHAVVDPAVHQAVVSGTPLPLAQPAQSCRRMLPILPTRAGLDIIKRFMLVQTTYSVCPWQAFPRWPNALGLSLVLGLTWKHKTRLIQREARVLVVCTSEVYFSAWSNVFEKGLEPTL